MKKGFASEVNLFSHVTVIVLLLSSAPLIYLFAFTMLGVSFLNIHAMGF
jgi:hypothetical protein